MNPLTPLQQRVLNILISDTHEKRQITGLEIMKRIGLAAFGRRSVPGADMRHIIHALRIKGFPICANSRGYFYARTDAALSKFIVQLQARLQSQEEALNGLKGSFHNVGEPRPGESQPKVPIFVKSGKESVTKIFVDIGKDGKPIIPEGVIQV